MSNRKRSRVPFPWLDLLPEIRDVVRTQWLDWHTVAALARTSRGEHEACRPFYPHLSTPLVEFYDAPKMMRGKVMGPGRARCVRKALRHILHSVCNVDFGLAASADFVVWAGPSFMCTWPVPRSLVGIGCLNPTRFKETTEYIYRDMRAEQPMRSLRTGLDVSHLLHLDGTWLSKLREAAAFVTHSVDNGRRD
jgi:hypothetical protein